MTTQRRKREGILEVQHSLSDYEEDPELLACILSPAEAERKQKVWDSMNRKYLERHPLGEGNDLGKTEPSNKPVPAPTAALGGRKRGRKPLNASSAAQQLPDTDPAPVSEILNSMPSASSTVRMAPRSLPPAADGSHLNLSQARKKLFG